MSERKRGGRGEREGREEGGRRVEEVERREIDGGRREEGEEREGKSL